MAKKYTFEDFKNKVNQIHGNRIDVDEFNYINSITKGKCKCTVCGNVWYTRPDVLLKGHGCRKCFDKRNSENRLISKEYIQEEIYNNCKTKITIISDYIDTKHKAKVMCENCGYIWKPIIRDLIRGHGCPNCYDRWDGRRRTKDEFIELANFKHNNKYEYDINVDTVINNDYIQIICPEHGVFSQQAGIHLAGHGCPKCNNSWVNRHRTVSDFILKANEIHNNKYEYDINDEFLINHNYINIICPTHGVFKQTVKKHLSGEGCPFCNESHLEKDVNRLINEIGLRYERYKKFPWLNKQNLDFYLPDYNIAIECQGNQHFKPVEFFGGVPAFYKTIERDKLKLKLVKEHNIQMVYYLDNEDYLEESQKYSLSFISINELKNFLSKL